jgi:hypothetical protein
VLLPPPTSSHNTCTSQGTAATDAPLCPQSGVAVPLPPAPTGSRQRRRRHTHGLTWQSVYAGTAVQGCHVVCGNNNPHAKSTAAGPEASRKSVMKHVKSSAARQEAEGCAVVEMTNLPWYLGGHAHHQLELGPVPGEWGEHFTMSTVAHTILHASTSCQ